MLPVCLILGSLGHAFICGFDSKFARIAADMASQISEFVVHTLKQGKPR